MSDGHQDARRVLLVRRAELLLRWRRRVAGADELLDARDRDPVDRAADDVEASILQRVGDAEIQELSEIIAAIARIDEGRYGACEVCGAAIAEERLRALPEARRCAGCAATLPVGPVVPAPPGGEAGRTS